MQAVLERVHRCAKVRFPVLLRGETGTGKDIVARAIHAKRSPGQPLVTLNCGAIAKRLAESELFGHRKGAFTGATTNHPGVFERAGRGCIFLDEIGELCLELQPKLLRVLENGHYQPIGAPQEQRSKANLIAATHRPLAQWARQGKFREDLLYRLNILAIDLPPLRERPEDIAGLMEHFAGQAQDQLRRAIELHPSAIRWAKAQAWPGNLRQLRNLVLRAAIFFGPTITKHALIDAQDAGPSHDTSPQIKINRADFASMKHELVQDAMARKGNLRLAAQELGVPKSTLAGWVRKSRQQAAGVASTSKTRSARSQTQ